MVQLYLTGPTISFDKPKSELKAFSKTRELKPGESEVITLKLAPKDLASFNTSKSSWKNITFYTARHTFATAALRNGVNIHTIKQSLGHQSITTTENYLEDFSDNEVDKQLENIF